MLTAITLYNLSVQVETKDTRLLNLIKEFIKVNYTSITQGFGMDAESTIKIYAGFIKDHDAFFFTNNQFKHFNYFLKGKGYSLSNYTVINRRDYEHVEEDYKIKDHWELRENQVPVAEFIEDTITGTRLLPLATGSGKTFISLNSLGRLKNRFGIVIMPTFIDKWIDDIVDVHVADKDEIVVIRGGAAIRDIVQNAREGDFPWRYFIFSLPTLRNFITSFEESPSQCEEEYGVTPIEFFPILGIHTMLIDEVHLSFHAVYKLLLYSNVKFLLGLSATLIANDNLEARVHRAVFGDENIYHDGMIRKYIKLYPMVYNIEPQVLKYLRWSARTNRFNESSGTYSHVIFEQTIMKNVAILRGYFTLINSVIEDFYIEYYIREDKCIIFVSTIDMATYLTAYLEKKYPDKVIRRYVQDDLYEDMLEGEIIVTTIGSAGTGLDIPNLRVGIQTVSISSAKSNIQSMGRLRKLKDRDVKFVYLYAAQIDKQVGYHKLRLDLFRDRVESITRLRSNISLNFVAKEKKDGK